MDKSMFSIVVPVYGVEDYLDKCVSSVLSQKYTNYEIILVDDGSKDKCPQMCDEYAKKDNRIKVIHKTNGGLVSARQAGAEIASGEYIICVDGDDWIDKDYLEKINNVIKEFSPDIICFGYYKAYPDREIRVPMDVRIGYYNRENIEMEIFPNMISGLKKNGFPHSLCTKVFLRRLYVKNQLLVNPQIIMGEDAACSFPTVFEANSIFVLPDCLYHYRQNPVSISKVKKPFSWDGPQIIGSHFEKALDVNYGDFRSQIDRHIVYELFIVAASQFRKQEKYKNIRREINAGLDNPYYNGVVSRCKYSKNWRNVLFLATLKHRLTFILKLYCLAKL